MQDARRTVTGRPGHGRARRRLRTAGVAALAGASLLLGTGPGASGAVQQRPSAPAPGPVTVVGEPLVHTFDLDVPGDLVEGVWTVVGERAEVVPYDGVLEPVGVVSPELAEALVVQYGRVGAGGEVVSWHDAGTLDRPRTYGHALDTRPAVSAAAPTSIPVRVSLPDPAALASQAGQVLTVEARFTIGYLDDASGSRPGEGLALTGLWPWWLAVAAVLVALGAVLARGRRGPDEPSDRAGRGARAAPRP